MKFSTTMLTKPHMTKIPRMPAFVCEFNICAVRYGNPTTSANKTNGIENLKMICFMIFAFCSFLTHIRRTNKLNKTASQLQIQLMQAHNSSNRQHQVYTTYLILCNRDKTI